MTKDNQVAGQIPYVSSSALNNGIDNFVSNSNDFRKFNNCLSLANSGSVGSCFYQPFTFVASDHITHLKNEQFTQYQYLFIATLLSRLNEKYNFNREINDVRISNEKIVLPINEYREPDYMFMEEYSKMIMIKKLLSYIEGFNLITANV